MILIFKAAIVALLLLMVALLYRVIKGPTAIDRLVAVNMIGTKATVVLVLMGIVFERVDMFVDIAIAYGLLNFIASVAAARYFQQQDETEEEAA
mgnify:CR=1 FL=1